MQVVDVVQGTPEWHLARCGKVTASRIADVMAKLKSGGEAAGRRNYRAQIVAEILTGIPQDGDYVSAEMQRGTELEPLARAAYEIRTGGFVDQVGFVCHPTLRAGASPDGLVGTDGLLELKVPNTATHIGHILGGSIPGEYQLQMLWQMECTGRKWCDFASYDLRLPEHLQLFVRRMERDEKRIAEIRSEVETFLASVDAVLVRLPLAAAGDDLVPVLTASLEAVKHGA